MNAQKFFIMETEGSSSSPQNSFTEPYSEPLVSVSKCILHQQWKICNHWLLYDDQNVN
jgi:hypothetical protein